MNGWIDGSSSSSAGFIHLQAGAERVCVAVF